ncbi:type III polyketide synthase [Sphingomonas sp. PWP1-2]|uniref:type III polyketide synthase n=1 Tax=Sphingomonas sp. PWP1-2 TaxID=2804558 RepID=UPI003CF559C1
MLKPPTRPKAHIVASASSLPATYYTQAELAETIVAFLDKHNLDFSRQLVASLFANVRVDGRHFEFSVSNFCAPPTIAHSAASAVEACVAHSETNVRTLLADTGLCPRDIALIASVTLTPAVPSIEARLMNRIDFGRSTRRMPLAGLGCMAGVAGINRVADYLAGHPDEAAILISCELSSGLWQGSVQADLQKMITRLEGEPHLYGEIVMALVTAALFGDGSGAVMLVGDEHPLADRAVLSVIDNRSNWVPDTAHIMGLDYIDEGMRNILRPEVKTFVGEALADVILPMLAESNLAVADIDHWTLHPGGPKIMDAAEHAFKLSEAMMRPSRDILRDLGNISSATVLVMLDRIMRGGDRPTNRNGLLVAMGPGFSQEATLVHWH